MTTMATGDDIDDDDEDNDGDDDDDGNSVTGDRIR